MENYLLFDTPRRSSRGGTRRRHGANFSRAAPKPGEGSWPATDFMLLEGGAASRLSSEASRVQARTASPEVDSAPERFRRTRHGSRPSRRSPRFFSAIGRRLSGFFPLCRVWLAAVGAFFLLLPRSIQQVTRSARRPFQPSVSRSKVRPASRDFVDSSPTDEGASPRQRRQSRNSWGFTPDPTLILPLAIALVVCILVASGVMVGLNTFVPIFPLAKGELVKDFGYGDQALLDFITPEASGPTEESLPPIPKSMVTSRYIVRRGDSLGSIASRFGIDLDTIISMNSVKSAKSLIAGTELKVPNMRGVIHVVRKGETLGRIARANGSTVETLADTNNLKSGILSPGQVLFIPGGKLSSADLKRVFGEYVSWPTRGPISSYFGYRPDPFTGMRRFHGGIDIVVRSGTRVVAIMDGRVADVGYNQTFGNYIIVNHADRMQSLYAHLSDHSVRTGQAISQGQLLGLSGNTGFSTAAHLHFGLYRGGTSVNPLKYLK